MKWNFKKGFWKLEAQILCSLGLGLSSQPEWKENVHKILEVQTANKEM